MVSTLDAMVDMVRVVDRNCFVVMTNRKMREDLGDLLGSRCTGVFARACDSNHCIAYESIVHNSTFSKQVEYDGRIFAITASPLRNARGFPIASVEIFRDITKEAQMHRQIAQSNAKMRKDIALAQRLQQSLLPDAMPQETKYRFASRFLPCEDIGGDMFDVIDLGSHYLFYMSDVAGHGVTAAMLTVFVKQAVSMLTPKEKLSPARALTRLLGFFQEMNADDQLYITMFLCVLDKQASVLKYANAGSHMVPLFFDGKTVFPLELEGSPLSTWFDDVKYQQKSITMEPGSRLLLYTDGLLENGGVDAIGDATEVLCNLLQKEMAGDEMLNHITQAFLSDNDDNASPDDIAMLLVEREALE